MISYTLAHVGINCANAEQARKGAALFEAMFGLTMKEGNSSVFAGKAVELMKSPYLGANISPSARRTWPPPWPIWKAGASNSTRNPPNIRRTAL